MSQNREAPAYQEYAATMLSKLAFRTMTLQDRGLLYTMKLECWVNGREALPADAATLAKILGQPEAEVADSLPRVMSFFEIYNGFIFSPELEDYRANLGERKARQSEGGKKGCESRISKSRKPKTGSGIGESGDQSNFKVPLNSPESNFKVPLNSLVQSSSVKSSKNQFSSKGEREFLKSYEDHESDFVVVEV